MDTHRSDQMKPSRAISPAFRSGPRQKPVDTNADEIIRFVREFQCTDVKQQSHQGAAGLKRKSVLPAIGGYRNSNDVISYCDDVSTFDPRSHHLETTRISTNSVNISTTDSGFAEKSSEPPDSNSDDNEDNNDYFYNEDKDDLDAEIVSVETKIDPFSYKSGVVDIRKESFHDFGEMKPVNAKSVFAEDKLVSSRSRRPSKILDNLMFRSGSSFNTSSSSCTYLSQPPTTSRRFSNGASIAGQLLRPRALPQLPPISRNEIPARPSAPSPSLTPPSPRSGVDSDEDNNFEDADLCDETLEIEYGKPVDFIDCR